MSLRHLLTVTDVTKDEVLQLIKSSVMIKGDIDKYNKILEGKTLLMLFEKPSLRTRVSFEVGMTQLGGHAIFYSIADSPLGKKENIEDTAGCLNGFVDIIMARVNKKEDIKLLAGHSTLPVLNALDDWAHPCQILADLQTISEIKGSLEGLKLTYMGDGHNNVTYDIMRAAAMMGFECRVGCPAGEQYAPDAKVMEECEALCKTSGGKVKIMHDAAAAVDGVDVVYTDSWMSYHIPDADKDARINVFSPYRVTSELMAKAKPDAIFMNCLPAMRGMEQTADVIDGKQSVVFHQASNRLHMQKAIMLFFLGKLPTE